jgi:hypothetical protein
MSILIGGASDYCNAQKTSATSATSAVLDWRMDITKEKTQRDGPLMYILRSVDF